MKRAGIARSRVCYRLVEVLLDSYRKAGRPGKAWRLVIEHVMALEDTVLTFKLAHLQMVFGMVDQSVDLFQEMFNRCVLRRSAIEAPLVANLIEALNRSERYQRAVSVYESLGKVELSEPTDSLPYNAGNAYLAADRPGDALRCYEEALNLQEDNAMYGDVNHSYVLHNLGNCYYKMKEDDTAIKYYKAALKHALTSAEMAFEECAIGDAHFAQDRRAEALHYYRLAADHGDAEARQRLSEVCRSAATRSTRPPHPGPRPERPHDGLIGS